MKAKILRLLAAGLLAGQMTAAALANGTANLPPIANAGGPYVVPFGSNLILDGSGSLDPDAPNDWIVSYLWDVDGDGFFDDASVAMPTVPWATISSFGWGVGQSHAIGLKVADNFGATGRAEATVLVTPAVAVPEPGTLALLGLGLAGLAATRRRG